VFGKVQDSVPQVEELRRKREEDAAKCGRIFRTIKKDSTEIPCPMTTTTTSQNPVSKKNMTEAESSQAAECNMNKTRTLLSTGEW